MWHAWRLQPTVSAQWVAEWINACVQGGGHAQQQGNSLVWKLWGFIHQWPSTYYVVLSQSTSTPLCDDENAQCGYSLCAFGHYNQELSYIIKGVLHMPLRQYIVNCTFRTNWRGHLILQFTTRVTAFKASSNNTIPEARITESWL